MSELKAYTYDDMLNGVADVDIEYYSKSEADKVIAEKDREIAQLQAMLEERNKQVWELEEERRWRKCSDEMPSANEGYFIALWEDKFPDIGYIGAEDDVIETIRDRGEGHSVEWWMPISSAPKEEDK